MTQGRRCRTFANLTLVVSLATISLAMLALAGCSREVPYTPLPKRLAPEGEAPRAAQNGRPEYDKPNSKPVATTPLPD
jgi:hypothetical protein